MTPTPTIRTTHLTATASGGALYTVVTFDDGRCGVCRDGQVQPSLIWPGDAMSECTAEFARLAQLKAD